MAVRYAWADVVPSDHAVPRGEWAGVRSSLRKERAIVQAGRKDVSNTFLFRACGGFVRLIITNDVPEPGILRRLSYTSAIANAIKAHKPVVEQAFSASVFATAIGLCPAAKHDIEKVAAARRCATCTCAMRQDGPLNENTPVGAFIAEQIAGSQKLKEIRHGA